MANIKYGRKALFYNWFSEFWLNKKIETIIKKEEFSKFYSIYSSIGISKNPILKGRFFLKGMGFTRLSGKFWHNIKNSKIYRGSRE